MGIKGFNKAIKELVPEAADRIPASDLYGKRVAIDTPGIAWRALAVGHRKAVDSTNVLIEDINYGIRQKFFIKYMSDLVMKFLRLGIVPIFIMEGIAPPEKCNAWARRSKSKDSLKRRLENMEQTIANIDVLEHTPELASEYKKLLRQDVKPREEEYAALVDILKSLGIPCIKASGEAERLCAALAIEGHVAGVYTKDTDIFPLGCQLMLTDMENTPDGYYFLCTRLAPILRGLSLRFAEFVDLCIMSGCDFNSNIPGYAFKKSYRLILEYRSIDSLPDKYDTAILNHVKCRQLFTVGSSDKEAAESLIIDIDKTALVTSRDTLIMYEVDHFFAGIIDLYTNLPEISSAGYYIPPEVGNVQFIITC